MIKINGVKWRFKFVSPFNPNLFTSKGSQALGCCDLENKIIYISKALNVVQLRIVLCHEITHAVLNSYGVDLSHDEEEAVAQAISYYGEEIINLTKQVYKTRKRDTRN